MLNFFGRRKPLTRIKEAGVKMAHAVQEEGLFEVVSRKALAEKRSDFVKHIINGARNSTDTEFVFPNGIKINIDTRKKGKEFIFAAITIHSKSSDANYDQLNHRLHEIAMEKSSH